DNRMRKRYKKFTKYFILVSIIAISILPVYNFYQYAKKYDKSKIFNIDTIQKYINYTFYKLFNRSLEQGSVITGKNNFLFLGNQYDNVLHKTNGVYRPSLEEIEKWTYKLKDLQSWYESKGIKFVLVIAPNKHSIYKEKLPNWMKYDGPNITDYIVIQSYSKNINLLDLRATLLNQKNKYSLLYPKHDTHWNSIGASIAYNETIEFLNTKYNSKINKAKFEIIDNYRGKSPLGNFLKVEDLIKIEDNTYKFDINLSEINIYNIKQENNFFKIDNDFKKIFNTNTFTNIEPKAIYNSSAINNQKLLFLCDSFSGTGDFTIGNSILYNETFKYIYKFHWSHIGGQKLLNFVEENEPDIVIYQVVERALYNEAIVTKPPLSIR
ncbi:MAG: hypothetical protein J0647_07080, partial [Campylobacteraceae bacterium]|nr:hypothetical protein [Campylobacteraceae bacterium]